MRDHRLERFFRRICPHVKFVENTRLQRYPFPSLIRPLERSHVYELRRAVHSLRLKSRRRIWQFARVIEPVKILGAGLQILDYKVVISTIPRLHIKNALVRAQKMKSRPTKERRPQYKLPRPLRKRGRAKALFSKVSVR
jgi:hypothetical protein